MDVEIDTTTDTAIDVDGQVNVGLSLCGPPTRHAMSGMTTNAEALCKLLPCQCDVIV